MTRKSVYVIERKDGKWEVCEKTRIEAFLDDLLEYGLRIAVTNLYKVTFCKDKYVTSYKELE